ncbi:MAG: FN3 associated domain-containing protein [Kiritimatiellales bacterium]
MDIKSISTGIFCALVLNACAIPEKDDVRALIWSMSTSPEVHKAVPSESTVMMRALRMRKAESDRTGYDTMQALDDFHADGLVWAYLNTKEEVDSVKKTGRFVQLTVESKLEDCYSENDFSSEEEMTAFIKARSMQDLNGNVVVPAWKRYWDWPLKKAVGNIYDPVFVRDYINALKKRIDMGADFIQRDSPDATRFCAQHYGAGFSSGSVEAFRKYLTETKTPEELTALGIDNISDFNYRDYLLSIHAPSGDAFADWDGGPLKEEFITFHKKAIVEFHEEVSKKIDALVGRHVVISGNNAARRYEGDPFDAFDWFIGELSLEHSNPGYIYSVCQDARHSGKVQMVTMPKQDGRGYEDPLAWEQLTRKAIAMAYASGGFCLVPWDIYMPGKVKVNGKWESTPRYFGRPEQYANTFAFIKAIAPFLDAYRAVYATGNGLSGQASGSSDINPVQVLGTPDVSAVVRVLPGEKDTPVIVHLIDWGTSPEGFSVCIDPGSIAPEKALRVKLLTPLEKYEKAAHENALKSKNYQSMFNEVLLAEGRQTVFQIPPLNPWGVLIIEVVENRESSLWSPSIGLTGYVDGDPLVDLKSNSHGTGRIYFTTDGSVPTEKSPEFQQPFPIHETTDIRTVEIVSGKSSEISTHTFRKIESVTPVDPAGLAGTSLHFSAAETSLAEDGFSYRTMLGLPLRVPAGGNFAPKHANPSFLRFDGVDDHLFIPGFSNRELAGHGFTVIMVSRSINPKFGMAGNHIEGKGGIPRLYMRQDGFAYNKLDMVSGGEKQRDNDNAGADLVGSPDNLPFSIYTFHHDGKERISMFKNGERTGFRDAHPPVAEFGSGGNLAIPMMVDNQPAPPGDIAEILVFSRPLSETELAGVHEFLGRKYKLRSVSWR